MTNKKLFSATIAAAFLIFSTESVHAKDKHPHTNLSEFGAQDDSAVLSMVNPNVLAQGQKNIFMHYNLIEVDLSKKKFSKKNRSRIGAEFRNKKKYSYAYDESFKEQYLIGHIPEGNYVIVSMETNRYLKFGDGHSQSVKCYSEVAPVYHFNAGQSYFLENAKTKKLKPTNESLNKLEEFVSSETDKSVQFIMASPIGRLSFDVSGNDIIGNKIKCPKGKSFTYVGNDDGD